MRILIFSLISTACFQYIFGQNQIKCNGSDCNFSSLKNIQSYKSFVYSIQSDLIVYDYMIDELDNEISLLEIIKINDPFILQSKYNSIFTNKFGEIYLLLEYDKLSDLVTLKSFYENGNLFFREEYLNGKLNGLRTAYFENGQLKSNFFYKNGKRQGIFHSYFQNGQLSKSITYENNFIVGEYLSFHENGRVKSKVSFINGQKEGLFLSYYEGGEIHERITYIKGLIEGEYNSFHENGNIALKCNYKNDLLEGLYTYYNSSSPKFANNKGHYINGKPEGIHVVFKEKSLDTLRKFTYKNGKLNGESILYYDDLTMNNIFIKENYSNGKLDGKLYKYYKNGVIDEEVNYVNNNKSGLYLKYYPSGKLNIKCNYYHTLIDNEEVFDGEYIIYFENGKIESKTIYSKGIVISFIGL